MGSQLIKALTSQLGRVFSRDQLMNEMYSDYRIVSDRAVDTHIKNLRKKLSNYWSQSLAANRFAQQQTAPKLPVHPS